MIESKEEPYDCDEEGWGLIYIYIHTHKEEWRWLYYDEDEIDDVYFIIGGVAFMMWIIWWSNDV